MSEYPQRVLSQRGICWCGSPLEVEAGKVFPSNKTYVWCRCGNGHLTKESEIPANLGSRT